jgi:hypothetical protein
MKETATRVFCGLLLLTLSTTALAQDSLTPRISITIASGNYAEAEMLITEAVKIGLISTAVAESYRRDIQQAQERSTANHQGNKQRTLDVKSKATIQRSPTDKPELDKAPLPLPYEPDPEKANQGRVYVTYKKLNRKTRRYYSGRTSMIVDLRKSLPVQADDAVRLRDRNHHTDENDEPMGTAFDAAEVDQYDIGAAIDYSARYNDLAYWRIRGREQQLIDFHGGTPKGGSQSDSGEPYRTENAVRAVAKDNKLGRRFHDASTIHWGQLYPYTGY